MPFLVAQRRALAQLSVLGIDWAVRHAVRQPSLLFTYRSTGGRRRATIGHLDGLITLDLDEADPAQREQIRATLGEQYRTPLGHIRHELGHYVWQRYVADDPTGSREFRDVFGDETVDYAAALDDHYARGDDGGWRDDHVSFYATAHPWEDFAESWAQVMHVHDVVSTGSAWGVVDSPGEPFDPEQWMSTAVLASARRQRAWPGRWGCATSTRSPCRRAPGARSRWRGVWPTAPPVPLDPSAPRRAMWRGRIVPADNHCEKIGGRVSPETRGNTCVHAHG